MKTIFDETESENAGEYGIERRDRAKVGQAIRGNEQHDADADIGDESKRAIDGRRREPLHRVA